MIPFGLMIFMTKENYDREILGPLILGVGEDRIDPGKLEAFGIIKNTPKNQSQCRML
jgi:hypothetical protein